MLPNRSCRPVRTTVCPGVSLLCRLTLLLSILSATASPVAVLGQVVSPGTTAAMVNLTPEDRAWLGSHRDIRIAIDPERPPLEFVDSLPKTRSGKIMRRLLKARAQGLSEGDISTLDE
jgi:hypothetical protein